MMRESVSHLNQPTRAVSPKLQWCVLVGVGALTMLTGIAILIALMNPENLSAVPTIALVCVLVLLCVPVPVLMLERNYRRTMHHRMLRSTPQPIVTPKTQARSIIHGSHTPHSSHAENHRATKIKTATPQMEPPLQST